MNGLQKNVGRNHPFEWLVVDLDGSLVKTDTLVESLLLLAKRNFWVLALCFWRLRHGKAVFKAAVADAVIPAPQDWPYRDSVLSLIDDCRKQGTKICLATAADRRIAESVADHVQCFDIVIGSDKDRNLKSEQKLNAIRSVLGQAEFAYVGDQKADLSIWEQAKICFVAGQNHGVAEQLSQEKQSVTQFLDQETNTTTSSWIKLLRIKQWSKNTLIFVPLIMSHQFADVQKVGISIVAFVLFGLAASGGYILNDLLDLESDRRHPSKRLRPLAAGSVDLATAAIASIALITFPIFATTYLISLEAALLLLVYVVLSLTYSLYLKKKIIADVLTLCSLFTFRIGFGGYISNIEISQWLLLFSMFIFLSLSFLKRYVDLMDLRDADRDIQVSGRGYRSGDLPLVRSMGVSSGMIGILILSFYVTSLDVVLLYRQPALLWIAILIIFYWQARLWFLAERNELPHDPVVFALTDRVSVLCGLGCGATMLAATFVP